MAIDRLPNVGRPKGSAWRHLQDEGIVWEGQVLITGDERDLAALLVVTNEHLVFVRGGEIALSIDRNWLDPAPVLRRTGTVQIWVTPPDESYTDAITFISRDGRNEAAMLLSLIGDHPSYSAAYQLPTYISDQMPGAPDLPIARSRRRSSHLQNPGSRTPAALPMYSVLDDDDFPPLVAGEDGIDGWEEAIAESLANGTPIPLANSARNPNDPLIPLEGFDSKGERDRRSWVIRIAGLFFVAAMTSAIVSGVLPGYQDIRGWVDDRTASQPGPVAQIDTPAERTPIPVAAQSTASTGPQSAGGDTGPTSTDDDRQPVVPIETGIVLGVGSDLPSETPAPTPEPTSSSKSEAVIEEPDVEAATEQQAPLNPQQAQPDSPIIPEPNDADTEAVIPETESEQVAEPDIEAAPEISEPAQIAEPSIRSGGPLPAQAASLESDEVPAQVFAMGGLRLGIVSAWRDGSLPDLTLGRNPAGEWVVLLIDATNWSNDSASLEMSDFRLVLASDLSAEITLDSTTGAVASFLNLNPVLRASESTVIAVGNTQKIALVFSVSVGTGDLVLLAGDNAILLNDALNTDPGDVRSVRSSTTTPELTYGTVLEVVDNQTVMVDVEGEQFAVQYYGLLNAGIDSCYGPESSAAHQALVKGDVLLLERERRNRIEASTYLRHAWIADTDGSLRLVSAELVKAGAAIPNASSPDVRFSGWLAGEALQAEASGAGLWERCEIPPG
ncbi:hypothetical protein BH23CHL5_BH23CHL5_07350 [soil metagenome]